MEVRLGSLVRGAQEAQGTAIIIDVFRAFTTAAIAFDHGAREITLVAEPEEAGDVIAFLASARASFLTGIAVNLDGGTSAVL